MSDNKTVQLAASSLGGACDGKASGNDDIVNNYVIAFFPLVSRNSIQEYNLRPDRDEAQLQEMLHEISVINKSQREQLERVREAEMTYVPLDDDKSFGSDSISGEALDDCEENGHFKSSDSDASSNSIVCSDGEDTLDHRLLPSSHETIPQEETMTAEIITDEASVKSVPAETVVEVVEEEEEPMDWYDLSRENWSDADKLLQKIEKTGSKTVQQDFLSSIG